MSGETGPKQGDKILVAMSGGVDSSVAAALLKEQGFDVIGVHMQLWDQGDTNEERFGGRCCSLVDANDARRVCDKLEIPYYVINAGDVFKDRVVDYFVHEYLQSRTPNPCAECNTKIKFNFLFEKAEELGCKWVATGHYAKVVQDMTSGEARLYKASDAQKDQTYFLFGLTPKALAKTLMPLGGLSKMMVRKLAERFGLLTAQKEDSMEICFIGDEGYKGFIERRSSQGVRPTGPIRNPEGTIVGEHAGLYRYTIGQKKGLPIRVPDPENYFVVGFDRNAATLIVGTEEYLMKTELMASGMNWIRPVDGLHAVKCKARIRSRHEEAKCMITVFENNTVHVQFDEPQRAITPGQAVVFYQNDEVLGGAYIDKVLS